MRKPDDPRIRRSNRKRAEQTAQSLIAALLLSTASGCATFDADHGPTPLFNQRPAARPVTVVLVQRGDTVAVIARRFGLSPQAVIDANSLNAPYQLTRGQRLVLPPSAVHVVSWGDTLSSIARAYGVPRDAIVDANDIATPDELQPGQRIAIPFVGPQPRTVTKSVQTPVQVAQLAPPQEPERAGPDPRLEGARYYKLGSPRAKPVFDGQGGPEEFSPPPAAEAPGVDLDAAYDEHRAGTKQADVEVTSSGKFIWPVKGKIISGFGRRGSGLHNDGINIAAEPGSPVRAADAGIVVYAGNELAGYGNLLLIRHPSGYVTAYAHNKKLLVDKNAKVKQGQAVALVGSTGDVDRPQLHFEIRKGDRAVDPNRYLSRTTASR